MIVFHNSTNAFNFLFIHVNQNTHDVWHDASTNQLYHSNLSDPLPTHMGRVWALCANVFMRTPLLNICLL